MGVFRKNGNFWIDYYVKGRRKREKVGSSKTLAEKALMKRKIQVAEDKFLDIEKQKAIRFKSFAELYIEGHARKKRSWVSTDRHYLKRLVSFFGDKYLHEIDSLLVKRYQTARRSEKTYKGSQVSVAYVNREMACLKCMFHWAIEWGYAHENPVKKVKFEKENNSRVRFLEKEELKKLLECCGARLKPIVLLAVNTGMRKAEIQNLKWRDVDLQRGFITLEATKNGETRRVPLNQTAKEVLVRVRKHPDSPYIFCKGNGNPYNCRTAFLSALEKAGIKDFRFHDLRHTAASYLAMSGVDLNTIRDILGHKSLEMVLRYAHLSPTHQTNAVSRLDLEMDTIWTPESETESAGKVKEGSTPFELIG